MKKLDWYILNKFISTFVFAILLFTVIAVVIDFSEKADDFVKSQLGFVRIMTDYYFGFIPHIMALLFPLFVFISVIFFTSKMAGKSEIIAILASGITFNRWLRPYFFGGVMFAGILWWANHYMVPNANKVRSAFEAIYIDGNSSYENLIKSRGGTTIDLYLKVDPSTYASIYNYDTAIKRGGPVFMNQINGTNLIKNTRAESIEWIAKSNCWQLGNVVERTLNGMHESIEHSMTKDKHFFFKPLDLNHDKYTKDKLTSPELARFIELEERRGAESLNELKVEQGRRDATAFSVVLLTLIAAVVSGRKVRGGSGAHLAMGFITAALFIITDKFSAVFSTKGEFPPMLAAWTPNILFSFVAYYFYRKAPK